MRLPRSVVLITALSKSGTGVGGRQGWACAAAASATSAAVAVINLVCMGTLPWLSGLNWESPDEPGGAASVANSCPEVRYRCTTGLQVEYLSLAVREESVGATGKGGVACGAQDLIADKQV